MSRPHRQHLSFLSGGTLSACMLLCMAGLLSAADPVNYNRDVRPILSDRCFFCHGPDSEHREADLRLDQEDDAKNYAIVPGHPEESEVVARIRHSDELMRMPPVDSGKSLTAEEIALIERWIAEGAEYAPYWAYVPPRRPPLPQVSEESWPANWIDRFLLARMEKESLSPAPPADRVTLLRRLSFDLIGLPPTPEEVQAFLSDTTEDAFERQVDRLLASEHFGERMAMYWLDLVRFADTVGYHGDQDHWISPYRDYVIESFNNNLPFDQFTIEQLAGDLLPHPTLMQRVATGYNRMLQTSHEGGIQPKEYLAIYGADRVRNVSQVWMGATMGCCQCHDHKYDPYTIRDFYSMQAFFADIDEAQHFKLGSNDLPTRRPPEIEVLSDSESRQLAELSDQLESLKARSGETGSLEEEIKAVQKQIDEIHKNARKSMVTVAIAPREIRVLPRGNWLDDSGDIVKPAIPEFLGKIDHEGDRATRLDLAHWLTDTHSGVGGLTARVMANRFWYLMFGVGLSKSLDDFGGQGEPPVHPELLDMLAVEFYESGWDVKHLIKLMVMSRAYRQSSNAGNDVLAADPENRFYARQSALRLPAEMVRDNALSISGLLVNQIGGDSVKPYQPVGYYRHLNFPKRVYRPDTGSSQWRRGVYVHWQRQYLHPMLKAFDAPSREECTAQRPRSNTPLAALVLLNDPTFVEAARGFADRILQEPNHSDEQRLEQAYRLALSRPPDDFEQAALLNLLHASRKQFEQSPEAAKNVIAVGDSPVGRDRDPVTLAAWMQVTRAILNLNETITRN